MSKKKLINAENLSLDEWLSLLFNEPSDAIFIDYEFPNNRMREEYLATVHTRTEEEIARLLSKFLFTSTSLGSDDDSLHWLFWNKDNNPNVYQILLRKQYYRRLILYKSKYPDVLPWEGVTWILDLLPEYPKQALEVLSAYEVAHFSHLPDGRLGGLVDAGEIIRARYIGMPKDEKGYINVLMSVSPREFENIIERLYNAMEYETILTPPQKDGGRDVIAVRKEKAKLEHTLIECKQYNRPIGVSIVRSLLGVVSDEKVNKGVLVTTSNFTKGSLEFAARNPRIELISGIDLLPLLNEHLGTHWSTQIENIIVSSIRAEQKIKNKALIDKSTNK